MVQTLAFPDEVVIWQAAGYRAWRLAQPDDLILFRPEGRARIIIGHGTYVKTTLHFARDAYALFGVGLGTRSYDDLWAQIGSRRIRSTGPNPVIAIALITSPVFFSPSVPFELPWPLDSADALVPLCSSTSLRGRMLVAALRHHAHPQQGTEEAAQCRVAEAGRVNGRSRRPAWSTLRSMTMQLYGHRCALSGERVSAVHDVIHIRGRQRGGADVLGNLMPLDTSYHRLVDRNLLAFDNDYRVMLSAQMGLFESSSYLDLHGRQLRRRLFGQPWPDEASLRWLRDRFKGPRYKP